MWSLVDSLGRNLRHRGVGSPEQGVDEHRARDDRSDERGKPDTTEEQELARCHAASGRASSDAT